MVTVVNSLPQLFSSQESDRNFFCLQVHLGRRLGFVSRSVNSFILKIVLSHVQNTVGSGRRANLDRKAGLSLEAVVRAALSGRSCYRHFIRSPQFLTRVKVSTRSSNGVTLASPSHHGFNSSGTHRHNHRQYPTAQSPLLFSRRKTVATKEPTTRPRYHHILI